MNGRRRGAGLAALVILAAASACTSSQATPFSSHAIGPATPIVVALDSSDAAASTPGATRPTGTPAAAPTAAPSSSPTVVAPPIADPTGTQSVAQEALVRAFVSKFGSPDFLAQGPVTGGITMSLGEWQGTGPVTGTFKIHGADSEMSTLTATSSTTSATATALLTADTGDDIRLGAWEYVRDFSEWRRRPAGPSFQDLVKVAGLEDHGIEAKFGPQLHRLVPSVSLVSYASRMGYALPPGVTISRLDLSFWAQNDGTPAGMSIAMTATGTLDDQRLEVVDTMDVRFTTFSDVVITAPATWVDASASPS